jgi:rsbT co-antagonist protein RsbR
MSRSPKMISIDEERLERLISAIALASTGEIALALDQINPSEQDTLGVVEGAMNAFLSELATTTRQKEEALAALADSKREIEEKLATIEQQQASLRELSVPIIDVWDGILTVPLIGMLDSARGAEVTERLLLRVADSDIDWVLLDLTGIAVVDTRAAEHLMKLAQAVRLLGARCILTGIGGQVAQTLILLGISFEGLSPMRSLREALRFCLRQRAVALAKPVLGDAPPT